MRKLYQQIYSTNKHHGHSNHGNRYLKEILANKPETVLDLGCGHNELVKSLRAKGIKAIGIDFACKSADVVADIMHLPVRDKTFSLVTAFDVLEHLQPEQVRQVLEEIRRVGRRYMFTISYRDSTIDKRLHPTVWTPEQWGSVILEHSIAIHSYCDKNFWHGCWL